MRQSLRKILSSALLLAALASHIHVSVSHAPSDSIDIRIGATPQLDGKISQDEWDDALKLVATGEFNTTLYLKHDTVNLFVAFYIPKITTGSPMIEIYSDIDHDGAYRTPEDRRLIFPVKVSEDMPLKEAKEQRPRLPRGEEQIPLDYAVAVSEQMDSFHSELSIDLSKLGIMRGQNNTVGIVFLMQYVIREKRTGGDVLNILLSLWPSDDPVFAKFRVGSAPPRKWGDLFSLDLSASPVKKPATSEYPNVLTPFIIVAVLTALFALILLGRRKRLAH